MIIDQILESLPDSCVHDQWYFFSFGGANKMTFSHKTEVILRNNNWLSENSLGFFVVVIIEDI